MKATEKLQNYTWHALPLAALVIWGALCVTNNLWYDEAYSASLVSLPWLKMIYITAVDAHSPFYYGMLKLFYHMWGGGTHFFTLKLFSLLFMLGYMLLGKYYVRRLFSQKISVYFMLFSLLGPIMSVQAGNVRMYALALFCMTLTGLLAYDIFLHATKKKWVLFTLAAVCTVYCHTFAMIQAFILYLLFLGALLYSRQYEKIKGFFISGIAVSAAFSPWLYVTCKQLLLRMHYDTGSVSERPTIYSFMNYCKEWFSALETPIGVVVFLGMGLAVVLGYFAVDYMRKERNFAPGIGVAALGLTILCGVLVSVFVNNCFLGRYAFPGFGFLMLFYAVGMSAVNSSKIKTGILAVAAVCFLLQYASELSLEYDGGLQTYEDFVADEMTEKDVMIGPYAHTLFLNVYHPQLQYYIDGYKSYKLPFVNMDELTEISQLADAEGNIWYICFEGGEPDGTVQSLKYEEALRFHYMYYDFVIYRLENNL